MDHSSAVRLAPAFAAARTCAAVIIVMSLIAEFDCGYVPMPLAHRAVWRDNPSEAALCSRYMNSPVKGREGPRVCSVGNP